MKSYLGRKEDGVENIAEFGAQMGGVDAGGVREHRDAEGEEGGEGHGRQDLGRHVAEEGGGLDDVCEEVLGQEVAEVADWGGQGRGGREGGAQRGPRGVQPGGGVGEEGESVL